VLLNTFIALIANTFMRIIRFIFVLLSISTTFPLVSQAAILELSSPATSLLTPQTQFEVTVHIDTEQESLNAFSGSIQFPANLLALQSIRDGGSIIGFWIERPTEQPITSFTHAVRFSGTIPGGFTGKGKLFSLVFQAVSENPTVAINATELVSLKNDGYGTQVETQSAPINFTITQPTDTGDTAEPTTAVTELIDTTPPKEFATQITQDPSLYENNWVAIFETTDPESGIDHYEIQESESPIPLGQGWSTVNSPYLLQDQERKSYTHIKAVNRVGLSTITTIQPLVTKKVPITITIQTVMWGVGTLLTLIFLLKYILRKYIRRNTEKIETKPK
jgi:hypothetical protein